MAHAITCSNVAPDKLSTCNDIMSSNIDDASKQQLISDLLYSNNRIPGHEFVRSWNMEISFNSAPQGVGAVNNGYIKDAWLKIISVMPSIILNGKLIGPGIGTILSKFNYQVEVPSGTEGGDCKTDFSLSGNMATLSTYLNGNNIGTGEAVNFETNENMDFEAVLSISTNIRVDHHKLSKYCCKKGRRSCLKWCDECKFSNTENRANQVSLKDKKFLFLYKPALTAQVYPIDNYQATSVGILNVTRYDAFELTFKDSYYKKYRYYYDLNTSIAPYNVLTIRANNFTSTELNNINIQSQNATYKFFVSNSQGCTLKYYDHFRNWTKICKLDINKTQVTIKPDKFQYKEDDVINVSLYPANTLMKVKYGSITVNAKNSVQFDANPSFNKIIAIYGGKEFDQIINVTKKDTWEFAMNLGVFSSILYVLYALIKKYWGVFL
ncbi:hypothetical protein HYX08_02895 [Candidatus Woesearchaeota archaeon]|nr:hypothetical protein [Candidatus Woesearchaeota archaeon]